MCMSMSGQLKVGCGRKAPLAASWLWLGGYQATLTSVPTVPGRLVRADPVPTDWVTGHYCVH